MEAANPAFRFPFDPKVHVAATGHGMASTGVITSSAECVNPLLAQIWRRFESVPGDLK
jgi:hypothetical protein